MEGNLRNDLSICNYCEVAKEDTFLYSTRRHFAGNKIIDILQSVTQLKIPNTIPIKLCNMCVCLLLSSTNVIGKASEMVSKHMPSTGKKQKNETPKDTGEIQSREAKAKQVKTTESNTSLKKIVSDKENTGNGTQSATNKSLPAPKLGKKRLASTSYDSSIGNAKNQRTKAKETLKSNALTIKLTVSPKKQSAKMANTVNDQPEPPAQKSQQSKEDDEDSLLNAIKLMPAVDASRQDKQFVQMFGNIGDRESNSNEDDEDTIGMDEAGTTGNDKGYTCKICDFTSPYPTTIKQHLKKVHGQKRPRVFSCTKCGKSFGLKNSLGGHMLKHDAPEVKTEDSTSDPQLAVLTALKPKSKVVEAVVDSEYSFGVNKAISSTPKSISKPPQTSQSTQKIQCEVCEDVFNVIKDLQEHLKNVHNIDRPKPFKCENCDSYFMHKSTMDRHYKKKHVTDVTTPLNKISARRSTVAEDSHVYPKLNVKFSSSNKPAKVVSRRKTIAIDMHEAKQASPIGSEIKATNNSPKKLQSPSKSINKSQVSFSDEPVKMTTEEGTKLTPSIKNGKSNDSVIKLAQSVYLGDQANNNSSVKDTDNSQNQITKMNDLPHTSTAESTEVQPLTILMNGSSKKKLRNVDSPNPSKTAGSSACKKLKLDMDDEIPSPDIIELPDEINKNVVPHIRQMQDSKEETSFSCDVCSKVLDSRKRLDSHKYKKHTLKLICSNCKEVYTNKSEYVDHFSNCKPPNGGLPCGIKICNKLFYTTNYLCSHLTKKHNMKD